MILNCKSRSKKQLSKNLKLHNEEKTTESTSLNFNWKKFFILIFLIIFVIFIGIYIQKKLKKNNVNNNKEVNLQYNNQDYNSIIMKQVLTELLNKNKLNDETGSKLIEKFNSKLKRCCEIIKEFNEMLLCLEDVLKFLNLKKENNEENNEENKKIILTLKYFYKDMKEKKDEIENFKKDFEDNIRKIEKRNFYQSDMQVNFYLKNVYDRSLHNAIPSRKPSMEAFKKITEENIYNKLLENMDLNLLSKEDWMAKNELTKIIEN